MLKHTLSRLCLSATLSLSAIHFSVWAASFDFRGEGSVAILYPEERELGLLLSKIKAYENALSQAQSHLTEAGILLSKTLDPSYYPAITSTLIRFLIEYEHKESNPFKLSYRTKLSYDSLDYPKNMELYYQEQLFEIEFSKRALDYNQKIRQELESYLNKLTQTQDETFRAHLRTQEGAKLLKIALVTDWISDAWTLFDQEKYADALEWVEKSLATGIDYPDLYWFKATIKAEQEKWDEAIQAINQAIAKQPQEPLFYFSRGQIYLEQGLLIQQAEADFEKIIQMQPNWGWAYFYRALIKSQRDQCSQALADYKKACTAGIEQTCKKTSCETLFQ